MAEQVGGVVAQNLVQMGGYRRAGVHHRVTERARVVTLRRVNPDRIQTKSRLFAGNAFQRAVHLAGVDGHFTADLDFAFAANHAFEHNMVRIRVNVQRVANTHRLNQKAKFHGQFFTHALDARHQLTAGLRVDQRDQAVADFQADQVHLVNVIPVQFFRLIQSAAFCGGGAARSSLAGRRLTAAPHNHVAHTRTGAGQ